MLDFLYRILPLLIILGSIVAITHARGYWWVVLLMVPGLLGVAFLPATDGESRTAGEFVIGISYALIFALLTLSGLAYLIGSAIERGRTDAPPRRSIWSGILHHAPLWLGFVAIAVAAAQFFGGGFGGGRITFAFGAAICLGYVVYRRIDDELQKTTLEEQQDES